MSRKVINLFFIIGSCLYIPGLVMVIMGYVIFFQSLTQNTYDSSTHMYNYPSGFGWFFGLLLVGALMAGMGGIAILVARIGALIEIAKAQEWIWFVLLIIFGWIVLLIYLLAGSKLKSAPRDGAHPYSYPAPGQVWAHYQSQDPNMMPPPAQPWGGYQQQDMPYRSQD